MSVEEISQDPTTSLASMNKKAVVEKPKELCKGCEKPSANNRAFATEKTNDKCYERGRGDVSETKAIINSSIQVIFEFIHGDKMMSVYQSITTID